MSLDILDVDLQFSDGSVALKSQPCSHQHRSLRSKTYLGDVKSSAFHGGICLLLLLLVVFGGKEICFSWERPPQGRQVLFTVAEKKQPGKATSGSPSMGLPWVSWVP